MDKQVKKDIEKLRALGLKSPGFKAPSNYFEEFSDALFAKIQEEELPQKTGFKTPDAYFENLDEKILSNIDFPKNTLQQTQSSNRKRTRILYAITSIAAAIVLYFGIARYQQPETVNFDSLTTTDIQEWIVAGNMSIDSYDIASTNTDEAWNLQFESEALSNEEINNYLDTVDPELLFLEN